MSDGLLSSSQAESLLKRISSDDAFRTLFETQPAQALQDLGIPVELIKRLPAACLAPKPLPAKTALNDLMQRQLEVTVNATMAMNVPWVKLGSS